MAEHRLILVARDVMGNALSSAAWEVSTDKVNFRTLSLPEQRAGIIVAPGTSVTVRVRQHGAWSVCQTLSLTSDGTELEYLEGEDFGTISAISTPIHERASGVVRHVYSACLSLLRDAMPDREQHENNAPPAYMYTVLSFDAEVLASGGSGLERFAASRAVNVISCGDAVGDLVFVKAPVDSGKPEECALFVPHGLDLSEPVPIHWFFSPSTGGKKLPYPYSDGDNSFNAMFHNYLVSGGKRFLSQHGASGKACVFAFPIPSPRTYFSNVQTAQALRSFCSEIVYFLRKSRGVETTTPALGRCAVSGFSEGGRPMAAVIGSSPNGAAFPELAELYLLDVMPPSGSSADTGSYHRLMGLLNGWWSSGKGTRKVRFYSQFYAFGLPLAVRGQLAASNGGANEYRTDGTTCFYAPKRFWSTVAQEQATSTTNPGYELDNIHQLMPCMFLEHALKNSGFQAR